ncbi:hypothetical protein L3Q82_017673 [Scortum barcoo]|uniref:Uncharacterized protein n=1 Tax=Scortum barcoo TaxID=214431 RepID=A0ACB8VLT3_9TELE|nr:hypothetical protein L3Q82_017673 [Scortum barcoo]
MLSKRQDCEAAEFPAGQVGALLQPLQLHSHLPPRLPKRLARHPLQAVQRGGEVAGGRKHSPSLLKSSPLSLGTLKSLSSRPNSSNQTRVGGPQAAYFCLTLSALLAHSSKLTCHPGINRTLRLVKRHFWWPSLDADVRGFVQACTICAMGKSSHKLLAGLLLPLPVPGYSLGFRHCPAPIEWEHSHPHHSGSFF